MKLRLVLKSFDGKILNLVINKLKLKFIENNFKIRDNLNKSKEALNIFRLNDENQYYFEIYDKIFDK